MLARRGFLAAAAAALTAKKADARLAIDGGTPVRSTPWKTGYFGTLYYDQSEWDQLLEVFRTRSPFRWWGDVEPKKVATFEKEFAAAIGTKFALGVTSGTTALQTAMAALEIGPGDEVILPAWTWHSCFNAVVLAGALPVCAEIDESFNIDPNDIEHRITPQTRAIMAVHLQGNPADLDRILPIARKHNLKLIEDCAQSVGGSYKGRRLGAWGDIAIYSLQLNKTITAGEGGAVVTSDPKLFERAVRFHDMGYLRSFHEDQVGGSRMDSFIGANYRMNEFTGGVLLAQTRKLPRIVADCRERVHFIYDGIADLPGLKLRKRPDPEGEIGVGVFLEFPSKELRDRFMKAMAAENVPARPPGGSAILPVVPHIEKKIVTHPAWPSFQTARGKAIQYGAASCPRTIDILNRFAGVMIDPQLSRADLKDAVAAIRKVYPQIVSA